MNFCPICATFLSLQKEASGFKLKCRSCEYYYPLLKLMKHSKVISSKQQALILTTEIELPICEAECSKCGHGQAYYEMMQTRSADEQSTIIYCCVDCNFKWSVDR